MKTRLIFFLFLFGVNLLSHSQTRSQANKVKLGIGAGLVSFIDYYYLSYGDVSVYTYLPSGLSIHGTISKNRHSGELGVLLGSYFNTKPLVYFGYNFRLSPEKWKLEVLAGAKFTPFYSRYSYQNFENRFFGTSTMLGATVQYRVKRWKYGISYYTSSHCYQLKVMDKGTSKVVYNYSEAAFQRLGTVMLNFNYSIN